MLWNAITVVLGGALVVLAGCESPSGHAKGPHTMPDGTHMAGTSHMLMCPKCETVWTRTLSHPGTKMQRMVTKAAMTCPSCDTMAAAYMEEGAKVLHNCPDCKATPVELQPPTAVHPKVERGG